MFEHFFAHLQNALTPEGLALIGSVLLIDLVLAGDNAIVVAMAANSVAPEKRSQVLFWGIAVAVILRLIFATIVTLLIGVVGIKLLGGLALVYICWKFFQDLMEKRRHSAAADPLAAAAAVPAKPKTVRQAIVQVAIADIMMSLDNVLAVAGASQGNLAILWIGLIGSVVMMGAAAAIIVRLMARYPIIGWVGLAVLAYVSLHLIYVGGWEVLFALDLISAPPPIEAHGGPTLGPLPEAPAPRL